MKRIDDNLLAAYLEGSLNEKDANAIEEIIESDPELLDFVAEWVALNESMLSLPQDEEKSEATGEHIEKLLPFVRPEARLEANAASGYDYMPMPAPRCECEQPAASNSRPFWRKFLIAASLLAIISIPIIILTYHHPTVGSSESSGNFEMESPLQMDEYDNTWENNDRPHGTLVPDTIDASDTNLRVDSIDLKRE